jgi:hypothetical protein
LSSEIRQAAGHAGLFLGPVTPQPGLTIVRSPELPHLAFPNTDWRAYVNVPGWIGAVRTAETVIVRLDAAAQTGRQPSRICVEEAASFASHRGVSLSTTLRRWRFAQARDFYRVASF